MESIGTTWSIASEKIVSQATKFGEKAPVLLQAKNWDRRNSDIKSVVEQIAQILDAKNVPWGLRVAKAIGKERPIGQIADFLGTELVTALWGAEVGKDIDGTNGGNAEMSGGN